MKNLLFFLLIISFTASAQSVYTVKGYAPELKDGDKLYLSYHLKNVLYKDSTIAKDHSFTFTGKISSIAYGMISAHDNPFTADEIHDYLHFYIEPGTITVNSADSLKIASVTGTQNNIDYAELSTKLKPYDIRLFKISTDFDALSPRQQEDTKSMSAYRVKHAKILKEMEPVKFGFIASHKDSYVSLVTLRDMLNQADVTRLDQVFNSLEPNLKSSADAQAFATRLAAVEHSGIGRIAPDFSLPGIKSLPVRLLDYRGKYVLIDFWASWCAPCRKENPNVKTAFEKYKSKNFTVISVSIDDNRVAWLKAVRADGLPWIQAIDANKKVHDKYGVSLIPANFLVDPSGKIIAQNLRDVALTGKLKELFDR